MKVYENVLRCNLTGAPLAQVAVLSADALPIRLLLTSPLWTVEEAKLLLKELTEAIEIAEEIAALPAPLTPEQQQEYDRASGQG